jgi:predicted small secreted protein
MRLRLPLALLAVALLVTACSVTKGSGKVVTQTREVSGFTKVELSGSGELTIEKRGLNRSRSRLRTTSFQS